VDAASGTGTFALAVWVNAAKSVTKIAPSNNRVIICFFIFLMSFELLNLSYTYLRRAISAVIANTVPKLDKSTNQHPNTLLQAVYVQEARFQ
jgi:hypothetical protein